MTNPVKPFLGAVPKIGANVFIADTASVVGNVLIGEGASIWYNVTVRGDDAEIRIGARTNVQDGTVIHVNGPRNDGSPAQPTFIGDDITIGHMALIHACTLQSGCFIGMKSCILDGAVVETGAMVAAGAVVSPGKVVRAGELWAGVPAKPMRELRPQELAFWPESIETYCRLAREHMQSGNVAR
jgi:carbonic anhydrase/acetyltransferase-like protein (isoleucine patch superfamily)